VKAWTSLPSAARPRQQARIGTCLGMQTSERSPPLAASKASKLFRISLTALGAAASRQMSRWRLRSFGISATYGGSSRRRSAAGDGPQRSFRFARGLNRAARGRASQGPGAGGAARIPDFALWTPFPSRAVAIRARSGTRFSARSGHALGHQHAATQRPGEAPFSVWPLPPRYPETFFEGKGARPIHDLTP